MRIRFLLDENLDPRIMTALSRRDLAIDIVCIGDPGVPPKETPDPDILRYVEEAQRLLITNNRISGVLIEEIMLLWEASDTTSG